MSNMNFNCDACGREVQGCTFVNGMKFCAKCYQETFGNNTRKFVDLLNTEMYELKISNLEYKLNEKDQRIAELEEQLKNAIVPKFNVGDYFIEYWDTEPSIYRYKGNNHFECLNKVQGYHCDYIVLGALLLGGNFIKKISKEEAEAKLRELQGEKK